jgi:hypothetical protein
MIILKELETVICKNGGFVEKNFEKYFCARK